MADDFAPIQRVVADLLATTAPAERLRILRAVAQAVRRSQAARIGRQQNPDGSAFAPRKAGAPQRFRRQGKLRKGAMFRKLRTARHLRAGADADEAWVGFTGRVARIAAVHQEGAADRPAKGVAPVRYARRILLGLNDADRNLALDLVLEKLAGG